MTYKLISEGIVTRPSFVEAMELEPETLRNWLNIDAVLKARIASKMRLAEQGKGGS